jgi:hypothetical protein
LKRRCLEHKKIKEEHIELLCFVHIEENNLTKAESRLHIFFVEYKLENDKKEETVFLNNKIIKEVKDFYIKINEEYGVNYDKMIEEYEEYKKNSKTKNKINLMKLKIEMCEKIIEDKEEIIIQLKIRL